MKYINVMLMCNRKNRTDCLRRLLRRRRRIRREKEYVEEKEKE